MTSYPLGALQNFAPPNCPPDLKKVGEQNWRMFGPPKDIKEGLKMIQTCSANAFAYRAVSGQYSQFVYRRGATNRVWIAQGLATPEGGGEEVLIQEYPSDIFDRSTNPQPMIDHVEPGKTAVLKCSRIADDLGQLYWSTD